MTIKDIIESIELLLKERLDKYHSITLTQGGGLEPRIRIDSLTENPNFKKNSGAGRKDSSAQYSNTIDLPTLTSDIIAVWLQIKDKIQIQEREPEIQQARITFEPYDTSFYFYTDRANVLMRVDKQTSQLTLIKLDIITSPIMREFKSHL